MMKKPKRIWTELGEAASQTDHYTHYKIRHDQDGNFGCTCMWWAFHRQERCKHIKAYLAGEAMDCPAADQVIVQAEGETFTVTRRRAISFGANLR